eukprot:gene7299-9047_t
MGLANAYAAWQVGITRFDACLAGIGGCPHAPGASGNVTTEDLAFMLERMGCDTGIDIPRLLALRERVAGTIRSTHGEIERELSPHWRGLVVARDRLRQFLPPWVAVAIGAALLLALLFGMRLKLAAEAEPVFKNLHALGDVPVQTIDRPPQQPKIVERPRLAGFLADEIRQQKVAVEDAVDRSVVTIRGDQLFASGSATIADDFQPLLLRIAEAIRKVKGNVLVTGHSDNRPIATLRY